jgi:ArsR family transcriptional regulator
MSMLQSKPKLDVETLAKQFWAIGDPVRLRILQMLPTEPTCEHACNVSTIAERVGLSQPAASHHLRILRQAGIITNRKMCRDMIYWVQPEAIKALKDSLSELG